MPVYFSMRPLISDNVGSTMHGLVAYNGTPVIPTSTYQEVVNIGTGVRAGQFSVMIQNGETSNIYVSCVAGGAGVDATAQPVLAGQGIRLWVNEADRIFVKTV